MDNFYQHVVLIKKVSSSLCSRIYFFWSNKTHLCTLSMEYSLFVTDWRIFLGPHFISKIQFLLHEHGKLRFSEYCVKWHLKQMLTLFIVMSVVVRLLLTSFYFSVYSFFFLYFSCPHLFYKKKILVFNKFIKNTARALIFVLEKVSLRWQCWTKW